MRAQLCNPQLGVWDRLTKLLNEDNPEKRQIVIESQNKHLSQKSRKLLCPHVPRGENSETPQRKNKAYRKRNFKKQLSENPLTDA